MVIWLYSVYIVNLSYFHFYSHKSSEGGSYIPPQSTTSLPKASSKTNRHSSRHRGKPSAAKKKELNKQQRKASESAKRHKLKRTANPTAFQNIHITSTSTDAKQLRFDKSGFGGIRSGKDNHRDNDAGTAGPVRMKLHEECNLIVKDLVETQGFQYVRNLPE